MNSFTHNNISEHISFSQLSQMSEDYDSSEDTYQVEYEDESNMTEEQKKELMIKSYTKLKPMIFSKESLRIVRENVNTYIVPKVKFITGEHTDHMSREQKEKIKRYPSFWQPDLMKENTLQSDILSKLCTDDMNIQQKVRYWKGICHKVLETIRVHRSCTSQRISDEVVPRKLRLLIWFIYYFIH